MYDDSSLFVLDECEKKVTISCPGDWKSRLHKLASACAD